VPLARVASHNGFVFGSLSAEVPTLEDFLGDMRFFMDLVADQGPKGMEFIPGRSVYTYRGNWKLQLDNGLDPYHLTTTHLSYMDLQARRREGEGHLEARQYDWAKRANAEGGTFALRYGHAATWLNQPEPEKRPIHPALGEIRGRIGELRAEWMLKARNTHIFPNMQIADAITLMLRTFRPVAADRTEMKSYCLAPIGEAPELRAWRLRQFEDFFNPGGMATPDDTVTYEGCQSGFGARPISFLQGYARGMGALEKGEDPVARSIGIHPAASVKGKFDMFNEIGFHAPYREWARLIQAGVAGGKAYP
jgi:phenylpropionate dioxygenase-like ring-hydroxylating dioxygenase large terminal subunit